MRNTFLSIPKVSDWVPMTLNQIITMLEWAITNDPAPLTAIATYGKLEKLLTVSNQPPRTVIKAIYAHAKKHPDSTYILWELR